MEKLTKQQVGEILLTIIQDAIDESRNFTFRNDPMGFEFILKDLIETKRKIRAEIEKE